MFGTYTCSLGILADGIEHGISWKYTSCILWQTYRLRLANCFDLSPLNINLVCFAALSLKPRVPYSGSNWIRRLTAM